MTDSNDKMKERLIALARVAVIARGAEDFESVEAIADAMMTLAAMADVLQRAAKHIGKDDWEVLVRQSEADALAAHREYFGDRSNVIDFPGPRSVN